MSNAITLLRHYDIQPTPQRLAVVNAVIKNGTHPSADDLLEAVRRECPTISRATVYNTLNLMAKKGLLKTQVLREGTIVFDPNVTKHHHFIDEDSGRIYDIPWDALRVDGEDLLSGFEIHEYQVVMRGRRKK
jgi:Fur family transcriptional regulator, iron response regulator